MRLELVKSELERNRDLYKKSVEQLALYFFIQGELASSHSMEIAMRKAAFYRHRLGALDHKLMLECDEALNQILNTHLEIVEGK
jgi:hypothetical protein